MINNLNDSEFQEFVENNQTVIVDFYAEWCQPCVQFSPIFESMSEEYADIEFVKVDIDSNAQVTMSNNVRSIPTLIKFENGKETYRLIGAQTKSSLKKLLDDNE